MTEYNDLERSVAQRSDLKALTGGGTATLDTVTHYDGLGRARMARSKDTAAPLYTTEDVAGVKVQNRSKLGGDGFRYEATSSPYRASTSGSAGGETTMGWTRTKLDTLGRALESEAFSGTALPYRWGTNAASSGKKTYQYGTDTAAKLVLETAADEAGITPVLGRDAIGGLKRVVEDPATLNYATTYVTDVFGNVTTVTEGTRRRVPLSSTLSTG